MLKIQGLHYHDIGPIDLTVEKGECVGLTGPSGIGKSLFLRAVADLDDHGGKVFFDHTLATEVSGPQWRSIAGLLPAESSWWHDTVGAHFGGASEELLRDVGFGKEVMDWEISRLSTGERQRLALVRLVSMKPKVLLLDEPTSSLDAENVERIERFLRRYRVENGTAVIWVSHDLEQLERAASRKFRLSRSGLEEF